MNKKLVLALMGLTAAGIASAADISVTNNITASTTWTSNNVYFLENIIYVEPGATLTIQAGTTVRGVDDADTVGTDNPGTLAICRGAKIMANGTKANPITFTSVDDDNATAVAESGRWGNLTILGSGLISATLDGGPGYPNGTDTAQMEGLTAVAGGLGNYGGANDDDDSGSLSYVSLRYGGFMLSTAVELNGLSLGGVGRGTDMHHIEIFNNADDGVEIWGGTVNMKYVSIWNIGDDNFDLDQGWRGKAQFGLLVQGYCGAAGTQGSGVGDNMLEMDGAESSTAQPYGAASLYNFTVIGQPDNGAGDQATEWRDNMRAQIRNSIFMDIGDKLVVDGVAGGGGGGWPVGDELTNLFKRAYSVMPASNGTWIASQQAVYPNFTDGTWCEMSDSVFYNIRGWGIAAACGLFNASANNVTNSALPIVAIKRSLTEGPLGMNLVTNLNPCAAGAAVTAAKAVPNDGFFTPVTYRGAFSPNYNWLEGWTAADAYGQTDTSMNANDPSSTIQMTASAFWQSEFGVQYTVEESSDMVSWSPIASVTGDGSIMAATDLASFNSAKFYRVVLQ